MSAKNIKTKFISALLIIFILGPAVLFSKPNESSAQWATFDIPAEIGIGTTAGAATTDAAVNTTSLGFKIKEAAKEILRQVAMNIAAKMLQDMTKSTINWVNSGNWGNPLFIENPSSFFKDISKYEVRRFVDIIGYDSLRFPFGKDFAISTINNYKNTFENNAAYSLSNVIQDPILLNSFRTDFNVGGWNGFLINTQYPQNNYIGFQMLATEELARHLQGTSDNAAQKIRKTLDEGMGFLSPQTCADNGGDNDYNKTIANQFKRPTFNAGKEVPYNPPTPPQLTASEADYNYARTRYKTELANYNISYEIDVDNAKSEWEGKNTCKNLISTTPGSVVASKIMGALNMPESTAVLAQSMGNSISAIVNALLNKLQQEGLNALASTVNQPPENPDEWDYYGNRLGSASDDPNSAWDSGPDGEIVLDKFKKKISGETISTGEDGEQVSEVGDTGNGTYIPGDIANTRAELKLITNEDSSDPGIIEMMGSIWPKVRELDICLPGPDINWQDRMELEVNKANKEIAETSQEGDEEDDTAVKADLVLRELQFAVKFFRDWIDNKMMTALPKSVIYMDAVEEIKTFSQQAKELTDARRLKTQALARLEAIKSALDAFTDQPPPRSDDEKTLIKLRNQYNTIRVSIANGFSINERENELNIAKDKYLKLNELVPECQEARETKGWVVPGGKDSAFKDQGTEENLFCDFPIVSGYAHEMFRTPVYSPFTSSIATQDYRSLPLVNAADVLTWDKWWFGTGDDTLDIELNCDAIFKANVLDYKGDIPGLTTVIEPYEDGTRNPGGGNVPGPVPDPDKQSNDVDEMCAAVERAVAESGKSRFTDDDRVDILTKAATELAGSGWGLFKKGYGYMCGPGLSCDIMYDGKSCYLYDVLTDTGAICPPILDDFKPDRAKHWYSPVGALYPSTACTGAFVDNGEGGTTGGTNPTTGGQCAPGLFGNSTSNPPAVASDFSNVTWLDGRGGNNISSYSQTATLNSVTFSGTSMTFDYTGGDNWLEGAPFPGWTGVIGNPWIFFYRDGKWQATTCDWMGRNKPLVKEIFSGQCGLGGARTFDNFQPQKGERYGFMISSFGGRTNFTTNTKERTNVVMSTWTGPTPACESGGTNPTPPPPNPNPTSGNPYIESIIPTTATPGVTTITIKGTNLSTVNKTTATTVQFFYGPTGKTSVDGTVNSAKTEVKVLVPSEVTSRATIKVYRDSTIQSNPVEINISGGGTTTTGTGQKGTDASYGWNGSVAYNTSAKNWLVVSQAAGSAPPGIWGRIMGNDGNPIGDVFKINKDAGASVGAPLVAYSPDANKFLVVWTSYEMPAGVPGASAGTTGRFVSSDKTMSEVFSLNAGLLDLTVGDDRTSALKYDTRNKKFVLVSEQRAGGQHAKLTTIDLTGARGQIIEIRDATNGGINGPSVAVDTDKNEYCVIYDLRSSPDGKGKWGSARINASTGAVVQNTANTATGTIAGNTDIEYNKSTKKYLAVYDYAGTPVKGQILNSCSVTNGGSIFTIKAGMGRASLAYNSKSNTFGVIGQGTDTTDPYVILNSTGGVIKSGGLFADPTPSTHGLYAPVIAPNINDGSFGATSSWNYGMTRFIAGLCSGTCTGTTGGTPTPTAAVPVLTSLNRMNDTLVITGTNLTTKVLFYNGTTLFKTYTGSVNTAKTETRLQIPGDIELDKEYIVKIQKTSTPTATSNGLKITIPRPDPASCTFNIPFTFNTITPVGKTESFDVDTQAGCAWTAKSSASWIKVTSGASVTGDGTVKVTISPNISDTATTRTGTLKVADKTLSVTQQGEVCVYNASNPSSATSADGGTVSIPVTAQSACSWSTTSQASWLTITSGSGSGNGTARLSVAPNRSATAVNRTGTIKIKDKTITITQLAGTCTFNVDNSSVSSALSAGEHDVFIDVTTESPCAWTAKSNTSWMTITDGSSDTGDGTVSISISSNQSGSNRSGTLTIAGKTITVTQLKP